MDHRHLSATGVRLPASGLGTWKYSGGIAFAPESLLGLAPSTSWNRLSNQVRYNLIDRTIELGLLEKITDNPLASVPSRMIARDQEKLCCLRSLPIA